MGDSNEEVFYDAEELPVIPPRPDELGVPTSRTSATPKPVSGSRPAVTIISGRPNDGKKRPPLPSSKPATGASRPQKPPVPSSKAVRPPPRPHEEDVEKEDKAVSNELSKLPKQRPPLPKSKPQRPTDAVQDKNGSVSNSITSSTLAPLQPNPLEKEESPEPPAKPPPPVSRPLVPPSRPKPLEKEVSPEPPIKPPLPGSRPAVPPPQPKPLEKEESPEPLTKPPLPVSRPAVPPSQPTPLEKEESTEPPTKPPPPSSRPAPPANRPQVPSVAGRRNTGPSRPKPPVPKSPPRVKTIKTDREVEDTSHEEKMTKQGPPQQHPMPRKQTLEISTDPADTQTEKEDDSETRAPVPATKRPIPPQRKSASKQSDISSEATETTQQASDVPQHKPALPRARPNQPAKRHEEDKDKSTKHEHEHKDKETGEGEPIDDEAPERPERPKRQPLPRPPPPSSRKPGASHEEDEQSTKTGSDSTRGKVTLKDKRHEGLSKPSKPIPSSPKRSGKQPLPRKPPSDRSQILLSSAKSPVKQSRHSENKHHGAEKEEEAPPKLPPRPGPGHLLFKYVVTEAHGIARHPYTANSPEGLSFDIDDVVIILSQVDENWLMGRVDDREGMFPKKFIRIVKNLPGWNLPKYPCAIAMFDFDGEAEDELTIRAGDEIRLSQRVNDEWLRGRIGSTEGIFPEHCVEIQVPLEDADVSSLAAAIDRTNPHGIALFDFDGQNPNELTFTAGAAIDLIDRVDSEWLRGNVGSEEGIFPASFVEIIIDIPEFCYAVVQYEFIGQGDDELTVKPGDRIKVLKEIDSSWLECELNGKVGRCPAPFVMVEAVAPEVEDTDPEETVTDITAGPHCVAMFDFDGQDGELSFKTDDVIAITGRVNSEWLNGQLNDRTGMFPVAFVQVVKDLE